MEASSTLRPRMWIVSLQRSYGSVRESAAETKTCRPTDQSMFRISSLRLTKVRHEMPRIISRCQQ